MRRTNTAGKNMYYIVVGTLIQLYCDDYFSLLFATLVLYVFECGLHSVILS